MANLFTCTNVWYDIADNGLDIDAYRNQGNRIVVNPLNFFDLALESEGGKSFASRQAAARAVLKFSDAATGESVRSELQVYIDMYREYLYSCATTNVPMSSDWATLETFLYITDGSKVLTSDPRWRDLAVASGHPECVILSGRD